MTKTPKSTTKKIVNQWTTQKQHQKIRYTTIVDQLRTVSWSNSSHPTCVVKPDLKGTNLQLTAKVVYLIVHGMIEMLLIIQTDFDEDGISYMLKAYRNSNETLFCNLDINWVRIMLKIRNTHSIIRQLWHFLGRSIAEVTDNTNAIGLVIPVYRYPTFPLTAKAV